MFIAICASYHAAQIDLLGLNRQWSSFHKVSYPSSMVGLSSNGQALMLVEFDSKLSLHGQIEPLKTKYKSNNHGNSL